MVKKEELAKKGKGFISEFSMDWENLLQIAHLAFIKDIIRIK